MSMTNKNIKNLNYNTYRLYFNTKASKFKINIFAKYLQKSIARTIAQVSVQIILSFCFKRH